MGAFRDHSVLWWDHIKLIRTATCPHCGKIGLRYRMSFHADFGWFCSEIEWDAYRRRNR